MNVEFIEFPLLSLKVIVISSFLYPRLSRFAPAKIFFISSSFERVKFVWSALIVKTSSMPASGNKKT